MAGTGGILFRRLSLRHTGGRHTGGILFFEGSNGGILFLVVDRRVENWNWRHPLFLELKQSRGDTGGILFFGLDTRNHYYEGKLVASWFASDEIKGVKNWGHPSFFGRRIFVASSFAGLA